MLKKTSRFLAAWGHYVLTAVCAAVILLSALWTRTQQQTAWPDALALADQSQRLSAAQTPETPLPAELSRPGREDVLQGYSDQPVRWEETGVWRCHRAVDVRAAAGEPVRALAPGRVLAWEHGLRMDHGNGVESWYRGLAQIDVQPGQTVRSGQTIGKAGGHVPFEGSQCHVCITVTRNGQPYDWLAE